MIEHKQTVLLGCRSPPISRAKTPPGRAAMGRASGRRSAVEPVWGFRAAGVAAAFTFCETLGMRRRRYLRFYHANRPPHDVPHRETQSPAASTLLPQSRAGCAKPGPANSTDLAGPGNRGDAACSRGATSAHGQRVAPFADG